MSKASERREFTAKLVQDMIAKFDESGVEYTCLRAIYNVVNKPIEIECAKRADLCVRARMVSNLVCYAIHRRLYPK